MAREIKTRADIDAFMEARKVVAAPDRQGTWTPSHFADEVCMKWPLAIEDELVPGAALAIIGNLSRTDRLFFRLLVLCPKFIVSRLDYTDETHPNSFNPPIGIPGIVTGPHYHSWPLNRRFFKNLSQAQELHFADFFDGPARTLDGILRWFCEDNGIAPLPTNHRIELPTRKLLV